MAPVGPLDVHDMLKGIRGAAILEGVRGAPPVDFAALGEVVQRVAQLAIDHDDIAELDINPLPQCHKEQRQWMREYCWEQDLKRLDVQTHRGEQCQVKQKLLLLSAIHPCATVRLVLACSILWSLSASLSHYAFETSSSCTAACA